MNQGNRALINSFYITLLAILLGSTMALGALVAPVIFKANLFFESATIDQFESGRLMSEIFRRYGYLLGFSLIFIAIYEIWEIVKGERSKVLIVFVSVTLITGLLFVFYYTPAILEMQAAGVEATVTAEFGTIHKQAEAVFKLLSVAVAMIIFLRVLDFQRHR